MDPLLILNRPQIDANNEEISKFISGKRVIVTGASGSIGSELTRYICKFDPECLILFDRNETNQFFLEREIRTTFPNVSLVTRLGSICDKNRVNAVFNEFKPEIVYHTAANKHVPLSETNASEFIRNNIYGTRVVAEASMNCEMFVLISTDKAVKPTSIMGATKRIAEYYIQSLPKCATKYVIIRFGNVFGSSGSVIPIFEKQIESGGPVCLTHPEMTRFFITINEAAALLLQSSSFANDRDVFILDMGKPIKIMDIAKNMIGDRDIEIKIIGIRAGEKLHEELYYDDESISKTSHPNINLIKIVVPENIRDEIEKIENLPANTDYLTIKKEIAKLIPEANL